jgi:hypothetical protein
MNLPAWVTAHPWRGYDFFFLFHSLKNEKIIGYMEFDGEYGVKFPVPEQPLFLMSGLCYNPNHKYQNSPLDILYINDS